VGSAAVLHGDPRGHQPKIIAENQARCTPFRTPSQHSRIVAAMRSSSTLLAIAVALVTAFATAQDPTPRTHIVETLDFAQQRPPELIPIGGKLVLVFEAHLTNLLRADAALDRIIVSSASSGRTLGTYEGDRLSAIIGRPGLPRDAARRVVAPGLRAIANFWIELDPSESRIGGVSVRVESTIRRAAGDLASVFESRLHSISRDAPVVLDSPLRGGPWVALYDPLLVGGHRTAIYTIDGRARIPGRFAIDWIRHPEGPESAESLRNGYGTEVLAVADALVVDAADGLPDSFGASGPVPPENAAGNFVTLDIGGGRFAFYEHLQQGSVSVRKGQRVARGDVVGRLGGSGSTSIGPHLHFHVADRNSHLGAEGLPFVFRSFEKLGAFKSIGEAVKDPKVAFDAVPAPSTRTMERPEPNSVIRFR
jgi:murein DD-endopeptidase